MILRQLLLLGALLASTPLAWAQSETAPNGVFLIAKPALVDPNFRHSVVLVTQAPDGTTVGFIINRPGRRSLAQILPDNEVFKRFTEPLYFGGPVDGAGLFAVFRAKQKPQGALNVLDDVAFALDPAVVEELMHAPPERVRFYNGYAGWAPGQLAAEINRGGWYVLNADADTVFRKDMDTLWEEMIRRVRSVTAFLRHIPICIVPEIELAVSGGTGSGSLSLPPGRALLTIATLLSDTGTLTAVGRAEERCTRRRG